MRNFRKPNQEEYGTLIAMLAIIFGGVVRVIPALISGFPINDGGLFVEMIEAIKQNGFRLPSYFYYNNLKIPFAYPPFAFYIGAITSNIFHTSSIEIVRWMPGIIVVSTIPAFYFLARAILSSSYQAGLATLIYAFTPRSFTWSIMGGGLTRSFGLLFLLLSLGYIYRLFAKHNRNYLLPSILFSALVVLTHPEAMIHTISFALLFWIFIGRDKQGFINGLFIALGTIALTSIWWLPTILHIGTSPFLAAAQTGSQTLLSFLYPFLLTLTDEPLITIVAVLGLIGFFACLAKKNYMVPIWYFIPFLVDPRSSATYAMIPLAMSGGIALADVILPIFNRDVNGNSQFIKPNPFQNPLTGTFLSILILYMLGGAFYFDTQISGSTLTEVDRTAFSWVKDNTPPGSRFLIMTGESQILCDSAQEWFPELTKRISVTTIQGNEWLPDKKYTQSVDLQIGVQSCMDGPSPFNCIERYHLQFDYVYIQRQGTLKNFCRAIAPIRNGEDLISALIADSHFQPIYQTNQAEIFSFLH